MVLPLDAVNAAAAREKSIRHGRPSTLHLWWSRKPLAAARAVIFAQTVDDPSEYVDALLSDPVKKRAAERELQKRGADAAAAGGQALRDMAAELERGRLFALLEDLVKWENTANEEVLEQARAEIRQSWRRACARIAVFSRSRQTYEIHSGRWFQNGGRTFRKFYNAPCPSGEERLFRSPDVAS